MEAIDVPILKMIHRYALSSSATFRTWEKSLLLKYKVTYAFFANCVQSFNWCAFTFGIFFVYPRKMMWTRRLQFWQPPSKRFARNLKFFASSPIKFRKKTFILETNFSKVNFLYTTRIYFRQQCLKVFAKKSGNFSLEAPKTIAFCCFLKNFFTQNCSSTHILQFWQPCWRVCAKFWKFVAQIPKKNINYSFLKNKMFSWVGFSGHVEWCFDICAENLWTKIQIFVAHFLKKYHNCTFFRNFSPQKFQCTLRMQVNNRSENISTRFRKLFAQTPRIFEKICFHQKFLPLKKVFPASRICFWWPGRIFCSNFEFFLLKFINKKLLAFFPKKVAHSCSSGHAECSFYNHLKLCVKNLHIFVRLLKIILKYYFFWISFPWKTSSRRGISFWPCRKSFLWSPTVFFVQIYKRIWLCCFSSMVRAPTFASGHGEFWVWQTCGKVFDKSTNVFHSNFDITHERKNLPEKFSENMSIGNVQCSFQKFAKKFRQKSEKYLIVLWGKI